MFALKIHNGDIVVDQGLYATVTGINKVHQDLRVAMSEHFGSDRFHPKWGSMLPEYIGRSQDDATTIMIRTEIERVVNNYIMLQRVAINRAISANKRPRFGAGEVVVKLDDLEVKQYYDSYNVRFTVTTMSNDSITLTGSVGIGGFSAIGA